MNNLKIGFVSDEISHDFEEAIKIGVSWGIFDYELRMIGKNRVPFISNEEITKILSLKNEFHLNINALSPGIFKDNIHDHDLLDYERNEVLPKTFQLANILDCNKIISFGFQRNKQDTSSDKQSVVDVFQQICDTAGAHNLIIAIENEPGFWCDSGKNTARILEMVDSTSIRANWDPANAIGTGEEPFPHGYESIKHFITNVHVKDTIEGALVACVPVGAGKVDWEGQLTALMQDQLVEKITIETHCAPLVENSWKNLCAVREIILKVNKIET